MKSIKPIRILSAFMVALALSAGAARAQSVTTTEIQRLQDAIYDASRDVSASAGPRLRAVGATAGGSGRIARRSDLSKGQVAEERKPSHAASTPTFATESNRSVSGLEEKRPVDRRLRQVRVAPPRGPARRAGRHQYNRATSVIPVGTEFDVRLQNPLSSATAQVEDRFEATTLVDLYDDDDHVLVPAGSVMRGIVSSVTKAGRLERRGSLTVAFDQITIRGRTLSDSRDRHAGDRERRHQRGSGPDRRGRGRRRDHRRHPGRLQRRARRHPDRRRRDHRRDRGRGRHAARGDGVARAAGFAARTSVTDHDSQRELEVTSGSSRTSRFVSFDVHRVER